MRSLCLLVSVLAAGCGGSDDTAAADDTQAGSGGSTTDASAPATGGAKADTGTPGTGGAKADTGTPGTGGSSADTGAPKPDVVTPIPPEAGTGLPPGMFPLISRGKPAFASTGTASGGNDADYGTQWRSNGSTQDAQNPAPQWIAYDLSSVPVAQRTKVVVFWIGHEGGYDSYPSYNGPGEYTIDCHAGAGGGSPPAQADAGWKTLAAVTDPPSATTSFGSRQHYIPSFTDGGGAACNWIRLRNTVVNGSSQNWDVGINMDVYDASQGLDDDWIFYGDSITCGALNHNPMTNIKQADFATADAGSFFSTLGAPGNLSELIAASRPGRFPLMQMGGHGGWLSADGVTHIPLWLPLFPGRFVGINFGTNDGGWSVHPADFQTNMQAMIDVVRAAGKTIIIPTIPSPIKQATVDLNVVITDTLWKEPGVLPGPDLYAFFSANPTMLRDGLHPTDVGYVIYRNLWAQKLLATVY